MSRFLSLRRDLPRVSLILSILLSVVLIGCGPSGPPTGTVSGQVLLNDAPYADAAVIFLSLQTGAAGSADLQGDGTFQLKAPLRVGEYRVFLSPKPSTSAEPTPVTMDKSVPDKYWNEATTDIALEVKVGPNNFTVALKK
jgi:hypothetical protein